MRRIFANLLIILGLFSFIVSGYYIWQKYNPKNLSFDGYIPQQKEPVAQVETIKPQTLIIKSLGIEVPIVISYGDTKKWETTTNGVSYLGSSPVPGEMGNSIMYGHNWTSILGKLVNAKPGEDLEIIYSDGSKKTFVIKLTQVVGPNQVNILDQTLDRRITLYTCTGFLDSKRFVVVAMLQ